ncbi:hypothetical protein GCM10007862_09920 [Dyella lipolytica]|uniref:LytTR family transcriptional regulator n=1 Tax=Dyella lipolytica TaxID=1867835 RepID=A0ABW8IZL0_9GAMM|nr:LytTR family DNA-binding domain-containing protein [Dyella lipolytica]GLQ45941.1 hypothetical protein GCM10007862_09920 [Dyella lipolytica]
MKRRSFDLLAVVGIFLAYSITLRLALHSDYRESLLGGAANTVPVVIFGAIVRRIIQVRLIGKAVLIQWVAHILLCAAFAFLSYVLLIVLLGLLYGGGPSGFVVKPLSSGGTVWQSLENVTTYALIAAISYLQAQSDHPVMPRRDNADVAVENQKASTAAVPDDLNAEAGHVVPTPMGNAPTESTQIRAEAAPSRYFVRIGDEFRPIDMDTVISISGADDYSEIRTLSGKHLVRVTLSEFTKSLDPAKYVRVHRSWIVNVHHIARAEAAGGGRLLLHMETGQIISTSRTGAKLLRGRVI